MSKKYYGKPETVNAYKKERARISKQISSMRKRGYLVPDEVLPQAPKKITEASIRRLKAITPKALYEQSEYMEQSTGEIIAGRRGRYYEREIATAKANLTKQINKLAKTITSKDISIDDLIDIGYTDDSDYSGDYGGYSQYDYSNEYEDYDYNKYSNISVNPIEIIRIKLESLPTIFYGTINGQRVMLDKRDAYLRIHEIFEQRVSQMGDNWEEIVEYCDNIMSELYNIIDDIIKSSDVDFINTQYARLMELIKGIPLSKDERKYAGEITDSTDDWEDDEDYEEW